MEPATRFAQYAAAFEETFAHDDWSRLEPYFTEGATYVATGQPPLGGRWQGRGAVLGQLKQALDDLDRRFDTRGVELIGTPKIGEKTFEMAWRATYEKEGCPDLVFAGTERATFEGDCIQLLEDLMEEGTDLKIQAYLEQHFD
jgi:hypothetical protein